jgi:dienelactone hydrolase
MSEPRRRRLPRVLAVVVGALVALAYLPPVAIRLQAAAVVAGSLGLPVPGVFRAPVVEGPWKLRPGLEGDLYVPIRPSPAIVLAHGAAPRGARDPRIVRLARAMAGAGRVVFVPQLELRNREFEPDDIGRLVDAVFALRQEEHVDGSVGLVGISYGGSYALIAAADPRIASGLGFVAVFGAYHDLRTVIQAVTTEATTPGGRVERWEPDPDAREILTSILLQYVPQQDREALVEALEGRASPETLTPAARSVHAVLANRDPHEALALVDRLPFDLLGVLYAASPARVIDLVQAPVAIMHSTFDPAVPPSEGRLLADRLDAPLYLLTSFRHVTPGDILRGLPDLSRATRFGVWILAHGKEPEAAADPRRRSPPHPSRM